MRYKLALCLVLLVARPVAAQGVDHRLFYAGVTMTGLLIGVDAVTTYACVTEFPTQCHEANGVQQFFFDRYGSKKAIAGNVAVKAGLLVVASILHHRKPEWDRMNTASVFTFGGVQLVVDISNGHTLQTLRNK